jgi:hypothetical protein
MTTEGMVQQARKSHEGAQKRQEETLFRPFSVIARCPLTDT